MNYIKKHWKTIIIALLVIFSLNKCTQSCNRGTTIDKQSIEIIQLKDSLNACNDLNKLLNVRLNEMEKGQTNYQNLALGTKEELVNEIKAKDREIDSLKSTNKEKDRIIKKQYKENDSLKSENLSLQKQLNDKE